jgi:hypothetical protein
MMEVKGEERQMCGLRDHMIEVYQKVGVWLLRR